MSARIVKWQRGVALIVVGAALTACGGSVWNDPYPAAERGANILYSSFSERPKHLDPARSYSANEYVFTAQIYEPPLQYAYLQRPYKLVPLTAVSVPVPEYLDAQGNRLPPTAPASRVARTIYTIHIKHGIRYQPHPAFARDGRGRPLYLHLSPDQLAGINDIGDFPVTGTRELVASDYVYEIKRLALPNVHSPILGLMSTYIVGLKELAARLQRQFDAQQRHDAGSFIDLRDYRLKGAEVVDRYTYRITLRGKYPQFLYWLAMPFFAPMPPEVARFYAQPGMADKNLTLDWYPVGTGPYMLVENNPNYRMVLQRNPNFHGERYPSSGAPGDRKAGLLDDAGRQLPFIQRAVYSLEREDIPYWNKFLQGYYDSSGISSASFDQAITIGNQGEVGLSPAMKAKGIVLQTAVEPSIYYLGFNMLDPVVGGLNERARDLRQAVSIAIDYDEYISIFLNGRGIPAQGPLPPGIFGYRAGAAGIDPEVYQWIDNRAQRRPIADAKRLLAEAGYPNGRDARTGAPLVLHLDITATGPQDKARLDWYRKQLAKINVQLVIRNTDYNRFQDKMSNGDAQLFTWGWNADYPDPENFLFLLYGPNGKVKHGGENAANYENPEFDKLFEQMKNMDNGPARQRIIDRMVAILHRDAPWVWGLHPKDFILHQAWLYNAKPSQMANNTLKYLRIDPLLRERKRRQWNQPVLWPFGFGAAVFCAVGIAGAITVRRRNRRTAIIEDET